MSAPGLTEPIKRVPTEDHLRSKKKPLQMKVPIYHDDAIANELFDAEKDLRIQELVYADQEQAPESLVELRVKVAELKKELEENTTWIVVTSMGREAFNKLKREHPPTAQDDVDTMAAVGQKAQFSLDTFMPAVIAATTGMSLDYCEEICRTWSEGEIAELYTAALTVNTGTRRDTLGKA